MSRPGRVRNRRVNILCTDQRQHAILKLAQLVLVDPDGDATVSQTAYSIERNHRVTTAADGERWEFGPCPCCRRHTMLTRDRLIVLMRGLRDRQVDEIDLSYLE